MEFRDSYRMEAIYFQTLKDEINRVKSLMASGDTEQAKTLLENAVNVDGAVLLLYRNLGELWGELASKIEAVKKELEKLDSRVSDNLRELNEKIDDVNNTIIRLIRELEERINALETLFIINVYERESDGEKVYSSDKTLSEITDAFNNHKTPIVYFHQYEEYEGEEYENNSVLTLSVYDVGYFGFQTVSIPSTLLLKQTWIYIYEDDNGDVISLDGSIINIKQSDWGQDDAYDIDYIKNKPLIRRGSYDDDIIFNNVGNIASAGRSSAFGQLTKMTSSYGAAFGIFNSCTNDTLFAVGNGNAENARYNIFELTKSNTIIFSDGTNTVNFTVADLIALKALLNS